MQKINLSEKFRLIQELWTPKIVGELNGQYIKIAKIEGEFVWHQHDAEDEYFQVIRGEIMIHFRDETVRLREGECIIVPRGIEHRPEAKEEAWIMMFEPKSTAHTGSTETDHTVAIEDPEWV